MTNREPGIFLRRWGEIGARACERAPTPVPWEPAAKMIAAAERDTGRATVALSELMKATAMELPGVGDDPLRADFGAHRWLKKEHELAYSDWLAWILEQRNDSGAALSLFGKDPGMLGGTPCDVERECCIPEGRLDLVVRCGTAALAVEIKTTSEPDEEQLGRYVQWLSREKQPLGLVLLAVSKPESPVPNEWSFRAWREVASGLRMWAAEWCGRGQLMQAAMTLAFCGAVEQNLLGYSRASINAPETARYIESWLEQRKYDKEKVRH